MFGVCEFVSDDSLAEIRLQEGFRLRQSQVEVRERLDLETERAGFNVEQVSAVQTVIRKEVEVVAGDAEGA